jgi:hypothetical protein
MTTIGEAMRDKMRERKLSAAKVAERASALRRKAGAPGGEITERQVRDLRNRSTMSVDDPEDPLRFVLEAIGVPPTVVLDAVGFGGASAS